MLAAALPTIIALHAAACAATAGDTPAGCRADRPHRRRCTDARTPITRRRTPLRGLAATAALPASASRWRKASRPSRSRCWCRRRPGGVLDVIGRAMAEQMRQALGQAVIVDYRPGASGMLAAQTVARAAPTTRCC